MLAVNVQLEIMAEKHKISIKKDANWVLTVAPWKSIASSFYQIGCATYQCPH